MLPMERLVRLSIPRMYLIHIRPENNSLDKVAEAMPLAHRGYAQTDELAWFNVEPNIAAILLKFFGPEIVKIVTKSSKKA